MQLLIQPQVYPPRVRCLPYELHWALLLLDHRSTRSTRSRTMGNAQSHGEPHNRLVKPRTNRNSPSLAPDHGINEESPISQSSRYARLSARDRQQIKTQLLSPVQTDFDSQDLPLGEEETTEDHGMKVQKRLSSRSNSMSCFKNKADPTARLSSLPASKVSLVQSSQAVDIETAIAILQEVQRNASPEDIAALRELHSGSFLV